MSRLGFRGLGGWRWLLASLVLLVLAWSAGVAGARPMATRETVVPRVSGGVLAAYKRLHAAGLGVSIARGWSFDSLAAPTVRRVSPVPGKRVRRGSVVSLSLSCCERKNGGVPPVGRLPRYVVPKLVGAPVSRAYAWVAGKRLVFRAHLGRLRAGDTTQLLENYRVTRQRPAAGTSLTLGRRGSAGKARGQGLLFTPLTVWGVQAAPSRPAAPCTPPRGATVVASDAQAVITSRTSLQQGTYVTGWYGCLRAVGKERLLTSASNGNGYETVGRVELAGRFVALSSFSEGKYFNCQSSVSVYDLATGKPGQVYRAGCSPYPSGAPSGIDSLALSSSGISAWRATSIPVAPFVLTGVSCPTASLCVAVDGTGQVGTATAPTGGREAWTFDRVDGQNPLTAVACPTAGLCVAVDHQGQVVTSTNPTGGASAWTASQIDGTTPLAAVSCPSASLCVAADEAGNVVTSTDPTGGASAWKIAHADPSFFGMITGISCPSTTLCVAVDGSGHVVTSTNPTGGASTWTVTHVDSNYDGLLSISCASPSLCVAGDGEGDLVTSTDPTAGASAWKLVSLEPPQTSDLVRGVDCPSISLCVAVDGRGNAITSTDPTAGAASWRISRIDDAAALGNQASLAAVSCSSSSLCVAVDDLGSALTTTDPTSGASAWSSALIDAPPACAASPCVVEQLYAHDNRGTQLIDSTPPGAGHSIANVSIDGNVLTWTHDGAPRQATL